MSDSADRTPLSQLLASMQVTDDGAQIVIPEDWLQGRAIYGGLSAALCLQTIRLRFDDLPPLRSAQVSFIGPAGRQVTVRPEVARRGKSTAFIHTDMTSDGQPAVRSTFCFGAARESRLSQVNVPPPVAAPPTDCGLFFEDEHGRNQGPNFAQHFNSRRAAGAMPMSGADAADFVVWMQHRDAVIDTPVVGLIALADALPPAAMACFDQPAPVSSMTWMFDLLTSAPATTDGWWLCRSTAQSMGQGYSSQAMTIWNADGEAVLVGRQHVAVFF